jgi:hypothetical protein
MKLNEFLNTLNNELSLNEGLNLPSNPEWVKDYEKILDSAIKIYKPRIKRLAHKAIEDANGGPMFGDNDKLGVSMAGDDVDYIMYDFDGEDENEDEDESENKYGLPDNIRKIFGQKITKEFYNYIKNKTINQMKIIKSFYDDILEDYDDDDE